MRIERKKNAVRGTLFGIILKLIQMIFPFIIRTIFVRSLGIEYLGLNSLFSAILQVLNLAELGVSSALVFSMYRPIIDDDSEKICQLMNLYRFYYRIIGTIVLGIGLILLPFLPVLIHGEIPADVDFYALYAMHLAATVLSYWMFAYRNSLFDAHQRKDITSIIQIAANICIYIAQVLSLILFHNYYIYLACSIVGQIAINMVTAVASKRFYPSYAPCGKLPIEERREINHKVRDLFTAKIGGVINHSVDSIVISAFIGLALLAIYQNYYYIISAIMAMFSIFFGACTAGIGNSLIVSTKEQNRLLFYRINHIVFMAINFCCTCFVSLCQPFMQLWVGDKYKLDSSFVLLFAIYLFAEEAPRTLIVFKDAGGIWKHDRFRPLLSAGVNLVLNLILTPVIGLYGIIISTIAAMMFVSFPWVIVNINKRLFEIHIGYFIKRLCQYAIVISVSVGASYFCSLYISINNTLLNMIIRFAMATLASTLIFALAFSRTDEHRYLADCISGFICKGKM